VVRVFLVGLERNLHLLQEVIERLHQVVNEVEFVVIHVRRHYNSGGPLHESLQALGVLVADQLVTLPMHEESRASHVLHDVDVAEAVIYYVLQHVSRLLPHDIANRHERAHQEKCARRPERGK